jgi:hypothetical protein
MPSTQLSRKRQKTRGCRDQGGWGYSKRLAKRLFTITGTFVIPGRGIVLLPGLLPVGDERFKVGDPILLMHPDGLEIRTNIGGLELPYPNAKHEVLILLTEIGKGDIPAGTEVWSA